MPHDSPPPPPQAGAGADPRDLVTQAYEHLRHLIVLGRLAPGSRIIESDLADRLGVSRTPVRSALQRLQQEGYVMGLEGGKNLRLVVAPLTQEDCREILNLIGALEGLAARWAAGLPAGPRRSLASELRSLNDALGSALRDESPDLQEIFTLHSLFHERHVEAAGAPRLVALHSAIRPQAERYRRVYITTAPSGFQGEVEEHQRIIDSVAAGDPDGAQTAVQSNWERTAERLGRIIERLGERGNW